ncbi:MAG: endonuclease/exonuclease/phosphatase family protein [Pseudomonadota bacterium]|nr:endonuclease/exonuclease/phosphatase family protein [Pseudomonadota bacterium]
MRLLLYNMRYGLGSGRKLHWPLLGSEYILGNQGNLLHIIRFIKAQQPDLVGLVEVDTGSFRANRINQVDAIAQSLDYFSVYRCKYGEDSLNQVLPIMRNQGNAFLSRSQTYIKKIHYFSKGIKRLVIELEFSNCIIFLVHLSLKYGHRRAQLHFLRDLVSKCNKPVVVAGDFNTFLGSHEMIPFMKSAGLRNANIYGVPSYPARAPRMELDFILYSNGIRVKDFFIPDIGLSDHLPLVCDFEFCSAASEAA